MLKRFEDYEVGVLLSMVDGRIPSTYEEMIASTDSKLWVEVMDREMEAMVENEVWSLVNQEEAGENKEISCKWVYSTKEKDSKEVYRVAL